MWSCSKAGYLTQVTTIFTGGEELTGVSATTWGTFEKLFHGPMDARTVDVWIEILEDPFPIRAGEVRRSLLRHKGGTEGSRVSFIVRLPVILVFFPVAIGVNGVAHTCAGVGTVFKVSSCFFSSFLGMDE